MGIRSFGEAYRFLYTACECQTSAIDRYVLEEVGLQKSQWIFDLIYVCVLVNVNKKESQKLEAGAKLKK